MNSYNSLLHNLIKKTLRRLNENSVPINKYTSVQLVNFDDAQTYLNDEEKKLDIIKKYFPFQNVKGFIDADKNINQLIFDNGIEIKGTFQADNNISSFTIEGNEYEFNYHPWGAMGSVDFQIFEESIKNIFDSENTYTICLGHENYSIINLTTVKSMEQVKNEIQDYGIYVVKGKQYEGKELGTTTGSKNSKVIKLK